MRRVLRFAPEWKFKWKKNVIQAGAMYAIETKTGTHCSHERRNSYSPDCENVIASIALQYPEAQTGHPQRDCQNVPIKASLSACTLLDLSADLACPCGQRVLLQDKRHASPERTFMCSPTHSFNEKKLHFPIVCGEMMEVHLGARGCAEKHNEHRAEPTNMPSEWISQK